MDGAPEQIGRYVVERELGSGGMGEVYLAFSPAGDPVAVKLIRSDRLDPVTRARFEKEALIARTVVGTNRVARFLDADPYAERPWLAMEYVPGQTLLTYVDGNGPLPAPWWQAWAPCSRKGSRPFTRWGCSTGTSSLRTSCWACTAPS